ncbi:MAG: patatin-like phospholipase family protein [Bacteroidota bacterium]|nr:patatin-like phospholipase family protein [Bacteroidota bacterium]
MLLQQTQLHAQKVGVVLSGGGASGLAHIGVLKALEENNIPIDYITGTSMGALVGAMYASGYSPKQMEQIVNSQMFKSIANGDIDDKYVYYFKQKDPNSSWVTLRFSPNSFIETSLPTNLISPIPTDLSLLEQLSGPSALAENDFNKLFVPFRCVASDVVSKKQVIFRNGNLSQAVRASMSYPFYLQPISIDNTLLFDGGLYNNFPSDIMYSDFFPDIVIGSSVSSNVAPPEEDNLISQIKSMLVNVTNYNTLCENGIMIEPQIDISLFDFDNPQMVIDQGYKEAMLQINDIKISIDRRISIEELNAKRAEFKSNIPPLIFNNIHISGLNKKQSNYVKRILLRNEKELDYETLKKNYYRLVTDDKINNIYPIALYNKEKGRYDLYLKIKKEREIITHFGGNISNRAINQGFVGLQYNYLGNQAVTISANSYFGKLYGSGQIKARIDFTSRIPFYLEGGFTLNRYDFFKSSSAFFEDVKPSYLIQNEKFADATIAVPGGNKGIYKAGFKYANLNNEYYQVRHFSVADTADKTTFNLFSYSLAYERNSLNRKQYASEGSFFNFNARFIHGEEFTKPGSTAFAELPFRGIHEWLQFKLIYNNYINKKGRFKVGVYIEGNFANQPFFNNYTGTILAAPAFTPTPETRTIFLEKFRAYKYGAFGLKQIFSIRKNLDLRLEAYVFQPYREIIRNEDQTASYGEPLSGRSFIGSTNLVYHTPVGPLSLSVNYYEKQEDPWSFLFHFGYILFNKRAFD